MTNHSDAILVEYILGNIDAKQDRQLTELLKQDNIDQRLAKLSQNLEIFNQVIPVKPSKQLHSNILSRISSAQSKVNFLSGFRNRLSTFFKLPKDRIDEILKLAKDLSLPDWDKNMIVGASLLHFDGGEGLTTADCGLIHLSPGNSIGRHIHNGDEWMLLLQGYLSCSDNNSYQPGDIVHRAKGTKHSVTVKGKQDCIFAVIADFGVTFY